MKTLVVYSSRSGFTRTFAEWIAEDLGAFLVTTPELNTGMLADADVVIHGGGLRATHVSGLKRFLRHWPQMKDKHVLLWHTGANPGKPKDIEGVWKRNLNEEQLAGTTRFYLRGGFDFGRLRGVYKLLMTLVRVRLKRKKELTEDEAGMLDWYEHPSTELDRGAIAPLVEHVRNLNA